MLRKEADDKYKWDIHKLYKDVEEWRKDVKKLVKINDEIASYKGKLNDKDTFLKVEALEDESSKISDKVVLYTYLTDLDNSNIDYQNMETELTNESNKMAIKTSWVSNEIKKIGLDKIREFIKGTEHEPKLRGYEQFFKNEMFILSEEVEDALTKTSRSRGAISDVYTKITLADKTIPTITHNGEEIKLTMTKYKEIMEESDPKEQELRREAAKAYSKLYEEHKHTLAYCYQTMWDGWYDNRKLRNKNKTALEDKLFTLNIPVNVYHTLIKVCEKHVSENIAYFQTLHDLVKNKYGFKEVYTTDSSLKISDIKEDISVDEARETIMTAVKKYASDEYVKVIEEAMAWGKIDYFEDENKYTGGYMTSRTYTKPYILMNWTNDFDSMSTLAHELGHAAHSIFSEKQHPALRGYPIYTAEVASVVAEEMLTQHLIDTCEDDKLKLHILLEKASRIYGLFFRQTQFAKFEYEVSKLSEEQVPLDADRLAKLFKEIDDNFTGKDIYKYWEPGKLKYGWTRISHFFGSPFYVYQYATCAVAAQFIFQKMKEGDKTILDNFLSLGGSKDPDVILKEAGVDLEKESTYDAIIKDFSETVKMIRELANER